MKIRRNVTTWLVLLAVTAFTGCATKPVKTTGQTPPSSTVNPLEPADIDKMNASRVESNPDNPLSLPPTGAARPGANYGSGGPSHVTLVIGGIGVASFATVGLLKKLEEEGVHVDRVVATGWPAIFALGYGYMKSVHDLEWFAQHLPEGDIIRLASFDPQHTKNAARVVPSSLAKTFKRTRLSEAEHSISIAAYDPFDRSWHMYDNAEWKDPLVYSFLLPGLVSTIGNEPIDSLKGLDVDAALARGETVVAVDLYSEYFKSLSAGANARAKRANLKVVQKQVSDSLAKVPIHANIQIGRGALDFQARRQAIVAGYQEGKRIAEELRQRRTASSTSETPTPTENP